MDQEKSMSELNLTLTEKFYAHADTIRADLSRHLKVGQPQIYFMRSVDPPSFIQLLGDVAAWLPLYLPAKAFLDTFGKLAAEAAWDKAGRVWDKIVNKEELKSLTDVATILVTAKENIDGKVDIRLGLNIPDDRRGTEISITSTDPEMVAYELATFLVHVEPLSKAMQEEIAAGREPFGPASIKILEDGSLLVNWITQDGKAHEIRVTL